MYNKFVVGVDLTMNNSLYFIIYIHSVHIYHLYTFISYIIGYTAPGYQQQYVVKPQKSKSGGILGSNTGKLAAGWLHFFFSLFKLNCIKHSFTGILLVKKVKNLHLLN